jgi:hypothetical protein
LKKNTVCPVCKKKVPPNLEVYVSIRLVLSHIEHEASEPVKKNEARVHETIARWKNSRMTCRGKNECFALKRSYLPHDRSVGTDDIYYKIKRRQISHGKKQNVLIWSMILVETMHHPPHLVHTLLSVGRVVMVLMILQWPMKKMVRHPTIKKRQAEFRCIWLKGNCSPKRGAVEALSGGRGK